MAPKVLLLGRLRDVAGWREREFDLTPARLSALREQLGREDQALGEALAGPGVQTAVNKTLTRGAMRPWRRATRSPSCRP